MTIDEFIKKQEKLISAANTDVSKYPNMRYGQALFNNAYHYFNPTVINNLTGTDADPFYIDKNIPNFWNILKSKLVDN